MKKCRGLVATTAAVTLLIGLSLTARAAVTMSLGDTTTYSGDPSGHWDCTVGGSSIVAGENVGVYQFNFSSGHSVWGVCISPQGWVDYNPHAYDVLPLASTSPLNSPAWNNGGLGIAAQILNTYLPTALNAPSGRQQDAGWALTAAIYGALFQGAQVTITDPTVQSYYTTFTHNYTGIGSPVGYVVRPDPYTTWHNDNGSGQYYGQQFLVPVPEPSTIVAGIGAFGLLLFGAGVRSKRSA